mmetsp:Transcript_22806/g.45677  ORF Transcript_22806/g.45677 Transcript_22806/m.45677 type:complete len:165 (-) Transcript_22806:584-1078(-)
MLADVETERKERDFVRMKTIAVVSGDIAEKERAIAMKWMTERMPTGPAELEVLETEFVEQAIAVPCMDSAAKAKSIARVKTRKKTPQNWSKLFLNAPLQFFLKIWCPSSDTDAASRNLMLGATARRSAPITCNVITENNAGEHNSTIATHLRREHTPSVNTWTR